MRRDEYQAALDEAKRVYRTAMVALERASAEVAYAQYIEDLAREACRVAKGTLGVLKVGMPDTTPIKW